ncbi:MAG: endolytic transglycosylase MltG, partial [Kangiellaceae bacterium]|nr:endolytic transglycosylase MltG [Kangiellaceae bacterium]
MNFKKLLSIRLLVGVLLLTVFLIFYWHWLAFQKFIEEPLKFEEQKSFVVSPGQTAISVASKLSADGTASNYYYLRLLIQLNPELAEIKKGEYLLEPVETPLSFFNKLTSGKVIQYPFTIIEGMNSHQVFQQLAQAKFLKEDWKQDNLTKTLGIESDSIEGWLYPDTYHVSKNSSALALLRRSVEIMQTALLQEWQNRAPDLPYKTPYEALIMASIIEKETGIASERDMIAGVFVRRLNKNMRLQTDPTVIYGIGPEFNGDITYKDLRTPTPYNTYVIKGLPPTPIAMPSRASIHAALNPADGEWMYFVATGDGGHKFSRTLQEHKKALKAYLRK